MTDRHVTTVSLPAADYEWIKENFPLSTISRVVAYIIHDYIERNKPVSDTSEPEPLEVSLNED